MTSAADIQEFTEIFNTFDRNKSGYISRKELSLCLTQCGFNIDTDSAKALLDHHDANDDNQLSLDEFIKLALALEKR
jgi:Ca2+-binding EF-hand superfamily protein